MGAPLPFRDNNPDTLKDRSLLTFNRSNEHILKNANMQIDVAAGDLVQVCDVLYCV